MGWIEVEGEKSGKEVKLYSLSYCHACERAKNYLERRGVEFRYLDVDRANSEEREEAAGVFGMDLPSGGMSIAFPIIVVDEDTRINGFDREKIANALRLDRDEGRGEKE